MKILLEEKILGTHSKKNSKYYWVLETITEKLKTRNMLWIIFPQVLKRIYPGHKRRNPGENKFRESF